jgi:glyoxylase-like metal-dependent hydrolase (beta-lactamase superfamily II)/rhodanese-related sulfurtransferase/anti-anti-sigma regulatory factor
MGAALFTVPVLFFGGTLVGYIPQASLAGVLLAVALRMINLPRVRLMWGGSRTIRLLLAATLLATLLLPLEWAVVVGAGLGLTIHLRRTTTPTIRLYYPTASGLEPCSPGDTQRRRVLQVSGSLYYAAVDPLIEALEAQTSSADTLVVDVSYAQELGYSALQALHRTSRDMAARNGQFIVAGVEPAFQRLIDRTAVDIATVSRGAVPGEALDSALRRVAPDLAIDTDGSDSALLFRQLFDRDSCTYTYLIGCAKTREAALIDTVEAHVDRDINVLSELGLDLKCVLETHLHSDHVTGAQRLRERTGCALVVSQGSHVACADQEVTHGDALHIGKLTLDVLSTPGHTGACVTYLLSEFSMAFTGDTVLVRGCGRTDYADGDSARLYRSVHEQIFTLPDETRLFPAHDYKGRTVTTVAEEKAQNPRLAEGITLSEFAEIMASLDLPSPRLMAVALPANRGGGRRESDGNASWPVVTRHDGIPEVEPAWVASASHARKIDVRNLSDLAKSPAPIDGVSHIPLSQLEGVATGWDRREPLVLISQKGVRSAAGVQMLLALGFSEVASMRGGWVGWPQS